MRKPIYVFIAYTFTLLLRYSDKNNQQSLIHQEIRFIFYLTPSYA